MTDDELLSAYLDHELPPDQRQALEARLENDPALAQRLADLERANARIRDAYGALADEPLPQGMLDLIGSPRSDAPAHADVIDLAARRPPAARRSYARPTALAAGVALAIGAALGYFVAPRGGDSESALIASGGIVAPGSRLYAAIETGASGSIREIGSGISVRPVLSFSARDGEFCRQLEIGGAGTAAEALACRRGGSWQLDALSFVGTGGRSADSGSGDGGFRPAGGPSSAIEAAIDERIDGDPLDADRERALIESGWTP